MEKQIHYCDIVTAQEPWKDVFRREINSHTIFTYLFYAYNEEGLWLSMLPAEKYFSTRKCCKRGQKSKELKRLKEYEVLQERL